MNRALLIVDVQHDFCPGGALATERGDEVARLISQFQQAPSVDYAAQVTTQDWHINPDDHFKDWPVHCQADTPGAQLHPSIQTDLVAAQFFKGHYSAAYSGFEASAADSDELLADWFRRHNISAIDVCGIATDHCVRATVLDGLKEGFEVRVLSELCAAVENSAGDAALEEMRQAGAQVL